MLPAQRRARILHLARSQDAVRVIDLMTELAVSDATVRRDLETLAGQGLVQKVHGGATAIAASTTDGQRPPAAAPHDTASPAVAAPEFGVLIPSGTYYCSRILDGIREAADQPGAQFTVNLVLSDGCAETERALITKLIDAGVQGLLLMPTVPADGTTEFADWLRTLPVPVVLVEREVAGSPLGPPSSVRTAHDLGAKAAVAHLYEQGHRQIALISRGNTQTFGMVRAGWEAAMAELGITPTPPVVNDRTPRRSSEWTTAELDELLVMLRDKDVTAMLCHNDKDALSIVQHAQSKGWSIPADLSIVAYDDELAPMVSPPLTAVAPPKERVGALAAATLRAIIAEGDRAPVRRTRVEPALVIRSSTAAPRDDVPGP
ncbi:MAG TPA: substrate-binding domain-containing protein [Mycobacteriales bacterium]|nr:substrate-binding domain-containing protein [Mycobacteriales bacterium]